MAKRGRPSWIPPAPEKVEALAQRGLTEEEIAQCLGIATSTLYEKKHEYVEFSEAIKRGKAKGIEQIANKLFEKAKTGQGWAVCFYLKTRGGWNERQEITHDFKNPVQIIRLPDNGRGAK
jgi:hypothetical protein